MKSLFRSKQIIVRLFLLSILVVFLGAAGCGGGGGGTGRGGDGCEALGARIFNGEECDPSARTPVVALFPIAADGSQLSLTSICTGTFVTLDDILTSAHCIVNPLLEYGSQIVAFVVVAGGATNPEGMLVSNLALHPFYDGATASPFDLAMVTVDRLPNPPIGPVPILISKLTEVGQKMSTYGYGTNNLGEVGVLKAAEVKIEAVQSIGLGGNLLATLESSGASVCGGDSGGPVIEVVGGVASVVGVNSFGSASGQSQCAAAGAQVFGFVDLQYQAVVDFIAGYAPDVAFN